MKLNNKKGFTLIELLIVTVVIVTLMGVVFRLAGAGTDRRAKAKTIDRLQKIENALSGYYAAYGSYPPVPLQGRSRSIYKKVDAYGVQESGDDETGNTSLKNKQTWAQIIAACRAQPLSVSWPPSDGDETSKLIDNFDSFCRESGSGIYKSGFKTLTGIGSLNIKETNWRGTGKNGKGIQLFEFGLLSFLFPRYLFMLEGKMDDFYDYDAKKNGRPHGQWAANNQLPCRLDTGDPFKNWAEVRKCLGSGKGNGTSEAGMISNLTSQAVCARWMPNFKGIVTTMTEPKYRFFYGVDVCDTDRYYFHMPNGVSAPQGVSSGSDDIWGCAPRVFSTKGYTGSSSGGSGSSHLLLSMTVVDGWGNEFFYYSEPPYQSYRLWSAGPNGTTFPPWYELDQFSGEDLNIIHNAIGDDIVHMSN